MYFEPDHYVILFAVSWSSAFDFIVGLLEVGLALVVVALLRRYAETLPWLVVLLAFFLLRGVERIYVAVEGRDPTSFSAALDAALLVVLVLLIAGLSRTVRTLDLLGRETRKHAQEYDRAVRDYHSLVRHRLANPLTAVIGAVTTLEAQPELDPELQRELLHAALTASERLRDIALSPQPISDEEQGLDGERPDAPADLPT